MGVKQNLRGSREGPAVMLAVLTRQQPPSPVPALLEQVRWEHRSARCHATYARISLGCQPGPGPRWRECQRHHRDIIICLNQRVEHERTDQLPDELAVLRTVLQLMEEQQEPRPEPEKRTRLMVDPACLTLARHFLRDEGCSEMTTHGRELAQKIQEAVEEYLGDHED